MQTSFTTAPLASYLAAIGLLRILGEQLDPEVRGCWRRGHFHLETQLAMGDITAFLANKYSPSPHITPWNKDSGFPSGSPVRAFQELTGARFAEIQQIAEISEAIVPLFVTSGRIDKTAKPKLFQALDRAGDSDAWSAWLGICGVIVQTSKGEQDMRFPALLGGSGGAFGRTDFGVKLMQALQSARQEHFEALIFGAACTDLLVKAADTMIYEPMARSDGQQGYDVATQETHCVSDGKANPAMLILVSEGLHLFEGYAITTAQDEEAGEGHQLASFTLAVDHNASGHPSSSWLEDRGKSSEELWCPLWDEPCHYSDLRDALRRITQLPLPRQLINGTDFALFASRLGRRLNLSGFARYWFPARIGKGTKIPSLIEVFPLRNPQQDRSDALATVVEFSIRLRGMANDATLSASFRHASEWLVGELEAVGGGGGRFAELLRRLVAWRRQVELSFSDADKVHKRHKKLLSEFRFGLPYLPPQWFQLLERELDSPEWRLALSLGTGQLTALIPNRPLSGTQDRDRQAGKSRAEAMTSQPLATGLYARLADVRLLLDGQLDTALIEDLALGISWIERRVLPRPPSPEVQLPWLPPDYLAGLLLNQWSFAPHVPVAGDRSRWRELLLAGRPEEAMAVALHRLRIAEVVSWPWPAITHSDPQRLLRAVQVAIHPAMLDRLRQG